MVDVFYSASDKGADAGVFIVCFLPVNTLKKMVICRYCTAPATLRGRSTYWGLFMMKKILYIVCLLALAAQGSAAAETMYITDRLEVAVRSGKGLEFKILDIARSNDKVELLGIDGEYANLRLENGKEGWILKRYLAESTPKPIVISRLEKSVEKFKSRNSTAREEIKRLKEEKVVLENTTKNQNQKIKKIEAEYQELAASCTDFIKLRDQYQQLQKDMENTQSENGRLKEENNDLRKNQLFWGAIAGLSFALLWFVLGMAYQGSRNKRKRGLSF